MSRRLLMFLFIVTSSFRDHCHAEAVKIPDEICAGSITELSVNLKEIRTNKRRFLYYEGVVLFDIKKDQIKPTLMQTLKNIMVKYPDYKEVYVALVPDRAFRRFVGDASYLDGKITIHYGIPSDAEMAAKNAEIGKPVPAGRLGEDKEHSTIMDHPRLYPPDRETFEKIKKICILARKVDNYRMEWKEICKKISEKNGMKLMEVEQLYWLMKFYYAPAAYGEETILL